MSSRLRASSFGVSLTAALIALACCVGCSGAPKRPKYLDDPRRHPELGSKRYIKAVGVSAASREEAELVARKRVSEQVLSTLQAVDSDRMLEIGDGVESRQFWEVESVIETRTAFERAELIRTDPASAHRDAQGWYILAYLDRRALAGVVETDYLREAGRFGLFLEQAREAYRATNPCGVLENGRRAREAFAEMEKHARVLFIARGGPYGPHRKNEERLLELFRLAGDLKHRMRFLVVMDGPHSAYGKERIRAMLQRFFEQRGLTASFCDDCKCGGPMAYRFLVRTVETQQWGFLGPVCRLSVSAKVAVCDTGQPILEMDLRLGNLKGAHTNDPARALQNAYDQLDEAAAYEAFREALAAHFCIER